MKPASPSITACVVVIVSCLAWIGAISLALVHAFDLSSFTGWIIAGSLGFSAVAAVTAILFEMRHAIDLENYVDPAEFGRIPLPPFGGNLSRPQHTSPMQAAASFQTPH